MPGRQPGGEAGWERSGHENKDPRSGRLCPGHDIISDKDRHSARVEVIRQRKPNLITLTDANYPSTLRCTLARIPLGHADQRFSHLLSTH